MTRFRSSHVESFGSDLIVVGKQGASTIADFFLGSVTRRLLSTATCDLLVLPRSAERSEQGTLGASKARPARHPAPPLATQPFRTDPWTTKH